MNGIKTIIVSFTLAIGLMLSAIVTSREANAFGGGWAAAAVQGIESFQNAVKYMRKWGENAEGLLKNYNKAKEILSATRQTTNNIMKVTGYVRGLSEVKESIDLVREAYTMSLNTTRDILNNDELSYNQKLLLAGRISTALRSCETSLDLLKDVLKPVSKTGLTMSNAERMAKVKEMNEKIRSRLAFMHDFGAYVHNGTSERKTNQLANERLRKLSGFTFAI